MDYDATEIPENYDRGRDHGPAVARQWTDVVASHAGKNSVRRILDLGCGTGRFSEPLADRFDADVIGIDPSWKMLKRARKNLHDRRVRYASAFGETIPFPPATFDVVFISMVFHHFVDPRQAASECRRVLRDGGHVCLRTGTRDRIGDYPYVPFFPAARPILEQRLPSAASQREAFEAASFRTCHSGLVIQQIAPDYRAYAEKLAAGADSILASLPKKEFEDGLDSLRSIASQPAGRKPVSEPVDFLVFTPDSQSR